MLTINLNHSTEQELNNLSKQLDKTIEQLINDVIADYLDDIHDAALADAALDELERGEDSLVSFEEWTRQINEMES